MLSMAASSQAWVTAYVFTAGIVLAGVVLDMRWLCNACFLGTLATVVMHVVRATLRRQLPPVRVILGCNVVVLAATSIVRDHLTQQEAAAIVAAVPLLSWFCYFGWRFALAPPRPGEALRPPKQLRECHWTSKLIVAIVFTVEFVQFNALSFNPALGAWQGLPSISSYYKYSFFVISTSEYGFEQQLWAYCALAIGWVFFACATLWLISHQRAAARKAAFSAAACAPFVSLSSSHEGDDKKGHLPHTHHLGPSTSSLMAAGGPEEGEAAEDASEYTMASPVVLVMQTIGRTGLSALSAHGQIMHACRNRGEQLVYCARNLRPACLGRMALVPIAPVLVFGAGLAAFWSLVVVMLVGFAVAIGLGVCAAFAAIALLHFPILMNMLSVLNCQYDSLGRSGHMVRMPTVACWEGKHWHFAGASVVTLAVLYPVMIHFERKRQSAGEVSYHVRFTACMLIGKLALSACSALLVSTVPPSVYLLMCAIMLIAFLHVNNQREHDEQPACCNVRSVRLLRSALLTCALWSAIVTLASTVVVANDWHMAAGLGMLWLLTIGYFIFITIFDTWEPYYHADAATLPVKFVPSQTHAKPAPPPAPASAPHPSSRSALEGHSMRSPVGDALRLVRTGAGPPPPPPFGTPPAVAAPIACHSAATVGLSSPFSDALPPPPSHAQSVLGGEADSGCRANGEGESTLRTVWLAAAPAARPLVTFYEFDDGFDMRPLLGAESGSAVAAAGALLPIVLSAQPPPSSRSGRLGGGVVGPGGVLLSPDGPAPALSLPETDFRPGDVIVEVTSPVRLVLDGAPLSSRGITAVQLARLMREHPAPLCLRVRRVALRAIGSKRSHMSSLACADVRSVTQFMMLFPQDADLQRAGCERLCRAVVDASQQNTLPQLLNRVRDASVVPVVINAMEVHAKWAFVLRTAARLLVCLANAEGRLRADLVAAGVLPALCAGLRQHETVASEGATMCIHALCDLAAEICSARGAPVGSRRAMCEALAATAAHRQVLRAVRQHAEHAGIVGAACRMLLAFQEEFEGSGAMPSALLTALCSQETLAALERAQRAFAHLTEIQLAVEWAVGLGRAARQSPRRSVNGARCLAKATSSSEGACVVDTHAGETRSVDARSREAFLGEAPERGTTERPPSERTPRKGTRVVQPSGEALSDRAEGTDRMMATPPPAARRDLPRVPASLSPYDSPSPRRALQSLQPGSGGSPGCGSAGSKHQSGGTKMYKAE
jgi:hypothetical protein